MECIRVGISAIVRIDRLIVTERVFLTNQKLYTILAISNLFGILWVFPLRINTKYINIFLC